MSPQGTPDQSVVVPGVGLMTPAYCSPEQAAGSPLTRRTDIWNWGVSILEMFTGELTWPVGHLAADILEEYLGDGAEDSAIPRMPEGMAALLRLCFRREPSERPRNMLENAARLQDIFREVTGEEYDKQTPEPGKNEADGLNNRAVSLLDLGRAEEAERVWQEALKIAPHHPEATYNQGLAHWRSGLVQDVELCRRIEESRKSTSKDARCDYYLGMVYTEAGEAEKAAATLQAVPDEDPYRQDAQAALKIVRSGLPHSVKLMRSFSGHEGHVSSACFSPDGRYILSGGSDGVDVRDAKTGKPLKVMGNIMGFNRDKTGAGLILGANSFHMSPDGRYLLAGATSGAQLWDFDHALFVRGFKGHEGSSTHHVPPLTFNF